MIKMTNDRPVYNCNWLLVKCTYTGFYLSCMTSFLLGIISFFVLYLKKTVCNQWCPSFLGVRIIKSICRKFYIINLWNIFFFTKINILLKINFYENCKFIIIIGMWNWGQKTFPLQRRGMWNSIQVRKC